MRTLALTALLLLPAAAQDVAIVGVRAHPVSSAPVDDATILVRDGVIRAVGPHVEVPAGATVHDGRGLDAYPGFVDGWTNLGLTEVRSVRGSVDTREMGDWNAHLRASAAVNPFSEHIPVARVNGVTTALVAPSGGRLPGTACVLDLHGRTVPAMLAGTDAPLRVLDLPTPPSRDWSEKDEKYWKKVEKEWKPLEEYLERARKAAELLELGVGVTADMDGQERLSLLATARHLERGHSWLVRADRREHILAALRFADKHGLSLVIGGLRDGWQVADRLKESPHGYLVGSIFSTPGKDEPYDAAFANPAALHRAGVRFGFMTGSAANVRNLPYGAAMAVAFGLPRDAAVRALTLGAAEALGLEKSHGSLYPGKVANVVLYDGDPLDVRVSPRAVFIRGRKVPLESRHTRLAAPFVNER